MFSGDVDGKTKLANRAGYTPTPSSLVLRYPITTCFAVHTTNPELRRGEFILLINSSTGGGAKNGEPFGPDSYRLSTPSRPARCDLLILQNSARRAPLVQPLRLLRVSVDPAVHLLNHPPRPPWALYSLKKDPSSLAFFSLMHEGSKYMCALPPTSVPTAVNALS